VYDITRPETFEALTHWISDFRSVRSDTPIVVIGNKIDLKDLRQVTTQEGKKWTKEHEVSFYECSAKLGGDLIPQIYVDLVRDYFESL
jgi:GTPase SAR1 family protein